MLPLSIVILTRNEAKNIVRCLQALQGLSDDVLIVDNGSTDDTMALARSLGARVIQVEWQGYSATKNTGNLQAKYDWILSLDADEVMDGRLKEAIQKRFQTLPSPEHAFLIRRKMVYGEQILHHGSVSKEYRLRIFDRRRACWNTNTVHEDVEFSGDVKRETLEGVVLHYSFADSKDHLERLDKYARLSAQHMHEQGRKPHILKHCFSPLFGFVKDYIFRLGFLDGKAGYHFAKEEMWYRRRKYDLLKAMKA
ncbi:MAG: glycosyltransferase family 2 protein [Chitinophagaceae bacterium]|nr:glycosyltransferase family 2 protein [Chitinophagaceae bacterium]